MPNLFTPHFPALQNNFSFLDNAAGAQVPTRCIDAISSFLTNASCNVGMPYPGSQAATRVKNQARVETAQFLNCQPSEIVIGTSATALTFQLARAFSRAWGEGDEVVISELEHEANASPWRDLERVGVKVHVWRAQWPEGRLHLEDLQPLLNSRTRLLAVTSAANSIGSAPDVAGAAALARSVGAWTITDLVHFAPHHLPDVAALGVDFAVFSAYKVFSTHAAFMYVREGLLPELLADKLHFIPDDSLQKFEPGTTNHEALAGWLGTLEYLRADVGNGSDGREGLETAYKCIEDLERTLSAFALEVLPGVPGLTLYGEPRLEGRVGTFCFNLNDQEPMRVAEKLGAAGIGVAAGHYYATMPMTALGLMPNGAIRASITHYSTQEDLERLVGALRD
jgi:cysteine desulfurase family protein (TIGR01976 family)